MFLGQFKQAMGQSESQGASVQLRKPSEPEVKTTTEVKASSADEFLRMPETKDFVREWSAKTRDGQPLYTKRGINLLIRMLFPNFESNKKVLSAAKEVLSMLGGMDGLSGFLMGWKAKSEGIIKVLKGIIG